MFHQYFAEIRLDRLSADLCHENKPALARQKVKFPRNVGSPDDVENNVNTFSLGEFHSCGVKVFLTVIDRPRRTKGKAGFALIIGARGGQDRRPEGFAKLDRGDSDAAR